MSTSTAHPGPRTHPGSPTAKASTAAAVVVLAAAVAGSALVAGIATGSSLEPPQPETPAVVTVTTHAGSSTPPITSSTETAHGGHPARFDPS